MGRRYGNCLGILRRCPNCNLFKEIKYFMSSKGKIISGRCNICNNIYYRNWRNNNKYEVYKQRKQKRQEVRLEVINAYGGICGICGENICEFLNLDHINGDGTQHRKNLPSNSSYAVYLDVKRQGFPKDKYRVLCYNCNCSLGHSVKSKEHQSEYNKRRNLEYSNIRKEVLIGLGGKCDCCGVNDMKYLTLDHINGGGRKHRKLLGSKYMYLQVKKEGFPKDKYRVLCYNCNCAIGHYEICPHQNIKHIL